MNLSVAASPSLAQEPSTGLPRPDVWVILPTYNEAENIAAMSAGILAAVPDAQLLVVDDGSPDGTGGIAERLAAGDARVRVLHRTRKEGLGPAYRAGFEVALAGNADIVVQMDADGSHDPAALPQLVAAVHSGRADLAIGSRYVRGGRVEDWPRRRLLISRCGSLYARSLLGLGVRDLTGGFKAWRASTLAAIDPRGVRAGGYVFQIEMTCRAVDAGARVLELPITFRDRRFGTSKMSGRIVREAFLLVLRLGLERRVAALRPHAVPS
jgi:dolichol-phosphate mannosyltransferase